VRDDQDTGAGLSYSPLVLYRSRENRNRDLRYRSPPDVENADKSRRSVARYPLYSLRKTLGVGHTRLSCLRWVLDSCKVRHAPDTAALTTVVIAILSITIHARHNSIPNFEAFPCKLRHLDSEDVLRTCPSSSPMGNRAKVCY
jgi:hypothetical protein